MAVTDQDAVAGAAQAGPVLLETSKNREVTLIDNFSTKPHRITVARFLLYISTAPLRERSGRNADKNNGGDKSDHGSLKAFGLKVTIITSMSFE